MEEVVQSTPTQHEFPLVMKDSPKSMQSLTVDSLFWLNLENKQNPSINSSSSTSEAVSSSSSSLNSFDTNSDDHKHALSTFYNPNNAASNSSLATLVQKLTESTTTLSLDSSKLQPVVPTTPPTPKFPKKTKSALKLTSLSRSRSMPDANIAVKTVRFSNDLTRVKTFNEYARPCSISLDNSPEFSPPTLEDRHISYESSSPKAFFDLQNSFNSSSSGSSSDDDEDYFNHRNASNFSNWTFKALNFDLFVIKNLVHKPVKLSSLQIVNNHSIHGTIEVSNFSFEKYVEVKFTTDSWSSIYLVTAKFERSLNSLKDQFTFDIVLNRSLLSNSHRNSTNNEQVDIGLCIKYVSDGSNEYYDNNNSQNYQIQLINKPRQRKIRNKVLNSSKQNSHLTNNFTSSSSSSSSSTSSSLPSSSASSSSATPTPTGPPFQKNYTTAASTRYFPDDTDYFNNHSVNNPKFNDWLKSSSINFGAKSSVSSTPNLDSSSESSSNSDSTIVLTSKNDAKLDFLENSESSAISGTDSDSKDEKYNQFLKKYCFFKPDQVKEEVHTHSNESFYIK